MSNTPLVPKSKPLPWRTPRMYQVHYPPAKIDSVKSRDNWVKAMMLDSRLSDRDKVILNRLALHLNLKTGRCDPSTGLLALECSISGSIETMERTIRRATERGEQLGWVRRQKRHGGDRRGSNTSGSLNLTNQYELRVPRGLFPNAVTVIEGEERPDKSRRATGQIPQGDRTNPAGRPDSPVLPNREGRTEKGEHSVFKEYSII